MNKSKGEIINIEIQVRDEYNMVQRTLYYWSKIYSDQLESSENYKNLARTVCINILNFKLLDNDRYHNAYRLKEITTNEELTDIEEIHFIELPKSKGINSEEVDNIDSLVKWIEFIKEPESEAVRVLEELTDKSIRKAMYDEISAFSSAKKEGFEEGLRKRFKENFDKGFEQG